MFAPRTGSFERGRKRVWCMLSSWRARAIGCALGMGLGVVSGGAWAQEAAVDLGPREAAERSEGGERGAPGAQGAPGARSEERRNESVRVDIGLGYMGGLGGWMPIATATFEGHLGGPAWLVVGGSGGWSQWEDGDNVSTTTSVGVRVGPRFEWHVIDRFDAGFYGFATGSFAHSETQIAAQAGGQGAGPAEGGYDALDVGGVAGASIHFRMSRVFGARVAVDIVRGGYATADYDGGEASSGYLQLSPSPAAELTFTF
jgi:hypothetical protein